MSEPNGDPRVAAFVLGEMTTAESDAFGKELAENAALRDEVEAFLFLSEEHGERPPQERRPGLSPEQQARIDRLTRGKPSRPFPRPLALLRRWEMALMALAFVALFFLLMPRIKSTNLQTVADDVFKGVRGKVQKLMEAVN